MTPTLSQRTPAGPPPAAPPAPVIIAAELPASQVTLISVAVVLLRHRWLIILSSLVGMIAMGLAAYSPNPKYTASATFTPRSRNAGGAGSAILQQLGLGGGGNAGYYLDLIRSREILGPIVESKVPYSTPDSSIATKRLIDLYDIEDKRPLYARAEAVERLSKQMQTSTQTNGMMKLTLTTENPVLSTQLTARILDQLNEFNLKSRQQQASTERQFIENQVAEAAQRLRLAEDQLQAFLNVNRNFTQTSYLSFEWDRLKRQVGMRQDLYTSLAKSLDDARIEEVRNSPVLTVIEPPAVPLFPDRATWPGRAVLGLMLGLLVGVMLAFIRSYFMRQRESETTESDELEALKREARDDLKHFWRPIGRILATGRT